MLQEFSSHINNLLGKEPKLLLVAVSGGVDSMTLCHLLLSTNYRFEIAHCNFQLRKEDSNADEDFVKQWGENHQINVHSIRFDTPTFAKEKKISIQMAARELRYSWFDQLKNNYSFDYIVTAHHCDDQIETFLINFLRGTGLKGLRGIPEKNDKYLRPLLPFSREQIEAYAKEKQLFWREDSSNASRKYLRNKLRHDIIPLLKEENLQLHQSFLQTITNLQQTESLLETYKLQLENEIKENKGTYHIFKIEPILNHAHPKSVLYALLSEYGFTEWNNVLDLLTAEKGKQIFSKTHRLEKSRNTLYLFSVHKPEDNASFCIENIKEVTTFGSQILHCKWATNEGEFASNKAFLDGDLVHFPLVLRKVKTTDVFKPLGMNKHKKVLKFLKDEGVPTSLKKETWVLTSSNKIIWVVNHRIDNDYKITSNTKKCLEINTSVRPTY